VEPDAQWPECLIRAREVIAQSIKTYVCAEGQEMDIQRLLVKGWVDSGSRRGTDLLNVVGSGNCAAMMCLGHDLKLKIFPKSQGLDASPAPTMNGVLLKMEDGAVGGVDLNFFDPRAEEKSLADGEKPPKRRKLKAEASEDPKSGALDGVVLEPGSSASTPTGTVAGTRVKRKYTRKVAEVLDQKLGALDAVVVEPSSASTPTDAVAGIRVKRKYTRKAVPLFAGEDQKSGALDGVVQDPSSVSTPAEKTPRRTQSTNKTPFIVTLVHGDILFLSGDNFEYSIVRSGTSILLVAFGQ